MHKSYQNFWQAKAPEIKFDLIMADEEFSGKTVKKSIFPRLLDKTAWTGE